MKSVEDKTELLLRYTVNMKRAEMVSFLKRYRGWELAEIANQLGYHCKISSSKVVPLQIVLNHLLSRSEDYKVG